MVGNIPNFTKTDILRCFLRLNKDISRHELAKELELGEGTIRTILNILKSKKLLDSTKKGHFLTRKGNEVLDEIHKSMSTPKTILSSNIYPNSKKVGILIKNIQNLKEVYKLRDVAVKNKADGAIILKFDKKLYAPEADYETSFKDLEKHFALEDNDVLAIAFANEIKNAENGAVAIAIELNNFIRKFINEL